MPLCKAHAPLMPTRARWYAWQRQPMLLARSVDGAYFSNLKLYDDYWKTRTSCFKTLDLVGVHLELLKEPQVHILASQFYKSRDN